MGYWISGSTDPLNAQERKFFAHNVIFLCYICFLVFFPSIFSFLHVPQSYDEPALWMQLVFADQAELYKDPIYYYFKSYPSLPPSGKTSELRMIFSCMALYLESHPQIDYDH